MKYVVSYSNPLTHCIDISLEIENIAEDLIHILLPSWRPGRYEIANFAKNILNIEAADHNGKRIDVKKISKDCWVVNTSQCRKMVVKYSYYAFEMDAGNSWLDDDQLYLNFINCMLYIEDKLDQPCIVELKLPEDYQIATGLFEKQKHTLISESYYQLVDSPLIASNELDHHQYIIDNSVFHIWIQGSHKLELSQMLNDFERFTKTQISTMGGFPCENYHFLIQVLPYKHYHGVEHQNSTTITLGPANELSNAPLYEALLGISSHELFHAWNVIRIRPKEMLPYNFSKENYFDTGYVAEGFTTYYGDLFLVRSGVLNSDWYLAKLNKMLHRHFENFGRNNMSVAESSIDLWLDGYVAGVPNRKVSIYNEGAIIALLLDLQLRVLSSHNRSLDDVMRALWNDYGKTNTGYDSKSIVNLLTECVEFDWVEFMDNYIYGVTPIEHLLSTLLSEFGCSLKMVESPIRNESLWGFRVNKDNCITTIQPASIAEKVLSLGDSVLNLSEVLNSDQNPIRLKVRRNYKEVAAELTSTNERYFSYYQVSQDQKNTSNQQEAFQKWLFN